MAKTNARTRRWKIAHHLSTPWASIGAAEEMAAGRTPQKKYYVTSPDGERYGPYVSKAHARAAMRDLMARENPRRVSRSTGWLKAKAVRIVKQHGRTVVQIKRAAKRRSR